MEEYKGVKIFVQESTGFDEGQYTVKPSTGGLVYKASFAGNVAYASSLHDVVAVAKKSIDKITS